MMEKLSSQERKYEAADVRTDSLNPLKYETDTQERVPYLYLRFVEKGERLADENAVEDAEKTRQLKRSYVSHTMRLIDKIQREEPDYLLFLDKSARPVSWLLEEFWPYFAKPTQSDPDDPESELQVAPLPPFRFANISYDQWRIDVGGKEVGDGQIRVKDSLPAEQIATLRGVFLHNERDPDTNEYEQPAQFDGKKVMIVDEVVFTGDTMEIAKQLVKTAFSDVDVLKHHWMDAKAATAAGLPDVAQWYKKGTTTGRNVGNRYEDYKEKPKHASELQKYGRFFLSMLLEKVDPTATQIAREIRQLRQDYIAGKLDINAKATLE